MNASMNTSTALLDGGWDPNSLFWLQAVAPFSASTGASAIGTQFD
jgi:hypothetical protein